MIPDFQSLMLPILKSLKDDEEKSVKIIKEEMIKQFDITKEEQEQKTPNNKQYIYYNKVPEAI
jgi:restriction system protein